MRFLQKHKLAVILTGVGAVAGFLYWRFIGCQTGTCPIKSVWYGSTAWGMAFGYVVGDLAEDLRKKRAKKNEEQDIQQGGV